MSQYNRMSKTMEHVMSKTMEHVMNKTMEHVMSKTMEHVMSKTMEYVMSKTRLVVPWASIEIRTTGDTLRMGRRLFEGVLHVVPLYNMAVLCILAGKYFPCEKLVLSVTTVAMEASMYPGFKSTA